MQDFRRLRVWAHSHALTLAVYRVSHSFPKSELYGLTTQMRRSAASVGANIAEGCGRGGRNELARFLRYAMGSASELEHHLLLAADLRLVDAQAYEPLARAVTDTKRRLTGLLRKLTANNG